MSNMQEMFILPIYILLLVCLYFDFQVGVFLSLGVILLSLIMKQIQMHKSGAAVGSQSNRVKESDEDRAGFDIGEEE